MAARGTGLPTAGRFSPTPVVDMTSSAGAAERANAAAIGAVNEVATKAWDTFVTPRLKEKAAEQAEADIAAGRFELRTAVTDVGETYNAAIRQGAVAKAANDVEQGLDELRTQHLFDPEGFQQAALQARSTLIENAPAFMVGQATQIFDSRYTTHLGSVRSARAERDLQASRSAIEARTERLVTETIQLGDGRPLADFASNEVVTANMAEVRQNFDALRNPAFGMSDEEVDLLAERAIGQIKAGAATNQAVGILRESGYEAALAFVETIRTDESLPFSETERTTAYEAARLKVTQEYGYEQNRVNAQRQQQARAEQDMRDRIGDVVGSVALSGAPPDLDLEEVREVFGDDGVLDYIRQLSEAQDFHNSVGDLSQYPPEEAARRVAQWQTRQSAGGAIPPVIDSPGDFDALVAAVTQVETGGNPRQISRDPDGAGPAGGGAVGAMQLLPATARRMAQLEGVPYDERRLLNDPAYNQRLGRRYLRTLMDRYNGDARLAVTAYHAGEGNVDRWLESVGDPRSGEIGWDAWLSAVEARGNPRSADYPRRVAAAMGGGRAAAAWDALEGAGRMRREDPASVVQSQIDVSAAAQAYNANPQGGTGYGYVDANLKAQERAGIPSGARRPLPNAVAMPFVARMVEAQRNGDTELYQALQTTILRQYRQPGRETGYGEAVLEQVLTMAGMSEFASSVTAYLAGAGERGQPPPREVAAQVQPARRTEAMTAAANGRSQAPVRVSNEREFAALPSGARFIAPDGSVRVKP